MKNKNISPEKFAELLSGQLRKKIGRKFHIMPCEILKINGAVQHSLTIKSAGSSFSPAICLDRFYSCYINGTINMAETAEEILRIYERNKVPADMDAEFIASWERAKKDLRCRLVSTERNAQLLAGAPHREILDLSIVYYLKTELPGGMEGVIHIKNEFLESWNVCEEDLHCESWKNMWEYDDAEYDSLMNILIGMLSTPKMPGTDDSPMYVLSNKSRLYGAVYMFSRTKMKEISDMLNSDLWIIPSSIHEVILLPCCREEHAAELALIIREINHTELSADEVLSDRLYLFSRHTGAVSIAA